MTKDEYIELFHNMLETWINRIKVMGPTQRVIYVAGVVDGLYMMNCALHPDDTETLSEVRTEIQEQYSKIHQ